MQPLVSVITPTTHTRSDFNTRIKDIFSAQTYPNKELVFNYNEGSIGHKRNECCKIASGEIICHLDSDDLYAPDWIERCVHHLLSTNSDVTGLSSAYFQSKEHKYKWAWKGSQPYVCEATMCYWRTTWLKRGFPNISEGEGARFQLGRIVSPHDYIEGFTATIHNGNTASHKQIGQFELIY